MWLVLLAAAAHAEFVAQYWANDGALTHEAAGSPTVVTTVETVNFQLGESSPFPGIVPHNQFSARFSGDFVAPQTGNWRFRILGDDRFRLTLNGATVINQQQNGRFDVTVDWGINDPNNLRQDLVLDYVEDIGESTLRLFACIGCSGEVDTLLDDVVATGLFAKYYNTIDFTNGLYYARVEPKIDYNFGRDPHPDFIIGSGTPEDVFGAIWEADFVYDADACIELCTRSDDGSRLTYDDTVIVDQFRNQAVTLVCSEELTVAAGEAHPIRVEYYENERDAQMYLEYRVCGDADTQVVPPRYLRPRPPLSSSTGTFLLLECADGLDTIANHPGIVFDGPGFYDSNDACTISLVPPDPLQVVQLRFDSMDIHHSDTIIFFDADFSKPEAVIPADSYSLEAGTVITSTGQGLTIKFNADSSQEDFGFTLSYEFVSRPTLSGIEPQQAIPGTVLTVSGDNLVQSSAGPQPSLSVLLVSQSTGAQSSCQVLEILPTRITCTIPEIAAEDTFELDVVIDSVNVEQPEPRPAVFVYRQPTLLSVSPRGGQAGSLVRVFASGLGNVLDSLSVTIGGGACAIQILSPSGFVECSAPAGSGEAAVALTRLDTPALLEGAPVTFLYIATPVLDSVTPSSGQVGEQVVLAGSGFGTDVADVVVTVGNSECGQVEVVSDVEIRCVLPPGVVGVPQRVSVSRYGIADTADDVTFLYSNVPVVVAIDPPAATAGQVITIVGGAFDATESDITIEIGGAECPVIAGSLANGNVIACRVPDGLTEGVETVVFRKAAFEDSSKTLLVIAQPLITAVVPPAGQASQYITVSGANFGADPADLSVTVGDVAAPCIVSEIVGEGVVCFAPPAILGFQQIRLHRFSTEAEGSVLFEYVQQPIVSVISPSGGVSGSAVTIFGTYFGQPEGSHVTIDDLPCEVTSASANRIVCVVPADLGAGTEYPLRVFNYEVPSLDAVAFELIRVPEIISIFPAQGQTGILTLTGLDFGNDETQLAITVGTFSQPCPVVPGSLNAVGTRVECSLPTVSGQGTAGPCEPIESHITISRFGASQQLVGAPTYTFVCPPELDAIDPAGGFAQGFNATLTGRLFLGNTSAPVQAGQVRVLVDGTLEAACNLPTATDSSVSCRLPAASVGPHEVMLYDYRLASNALVVTYVDAPTITELSPRGGSVGSVVMLEGDSFGPSEADLVVVSSTGRRYAPQQGSLNTLGTQFNIVIDEAFDETTALSISVEVFGVPSRSVNFTYVVPPVVESISPAGGGLGTMLTLTGRNFPTGQVDDADIGVEIGSAECAVVELAAAAIVCRLAEPAEPLSVVALVLFGTRYATEPALTGDEDDAVVPMFEFVTVPPSDLEIVYPSHLDTLYEGEILTVAGDNFGDADEVSVLVNGAPCELFAVELDRVECVLPPGRGEAAVVVARYGVSEPRANVAVRYGYCGDGRCHESEDQSDCGECFFYYAKVSSVEGLVVVTVAAIATIAQVLTLGVVYFSRRTPVISSASPTFCYLILLGGILGCMAIVSFIGKPTPALCGLRLWLPGVAFVITFSNLLVKTYRVYRIFDNPKLRLVTITNRDLLLYAGSFLFVELALLVAYQVMDPPQPAQTDGRYTCSSDKDFHVLLAGVLLIYKAFMILFGTFLSWRTRGVLRQFNESKAIGFAIYNTLFVAAFLVPTVTQLSDARSVFLLQSFGGFVIILGTVIPLFVRPVYFFFFRPDALSVVGSSMLDSVQSMESGGGSIRTNRTTSRGGDRSVPMAERGS